MKLSTLLQQVQKQLDQHGDIEVFVLDFSKIGGPIREPKLLHSVHDYHDSFFMGTTWEDLGLDAPSILIDYE